MIDIKPQDDWAVDLPTKRIGRPYNLKLGLKIIRNNILGPSDKYKNLTPFIPQSIQANAIDKKLKIGFTGDLMPMLKRKLELTSEVKDFFSDVDYLVTNFEGSLLPGKKVAFAQVHSSEILKKLEDIIPADRIILSVANNHTADFGYNKFLETRRILKDKGFLVIGKRDDASIKLDHNIRITACTEWSNQAFDFLSTLSNVDQHYDDNANMNILYPHWGHELCLYPSPEQIQNTRTLLKKWDVIAGHHPHTPSPVTVYRDNDINKIVAYSLGDFCSGMNIYKYLHGMIMKMDVGPGKTGEWLTGKVEWKFTFNNHLDERLTTLEVKENCSYFKI